MACAYCKEERPLTREHIYPENLINKFPEADFAFIGLDKAFKLSPKKHVIKDVCGECNNGELSKLDSYGIDFIMKYFSTESGPGDILNIEYNYDYLSRWVLKNTYNAVREFENKDPGWLNTNSKFIINAEDYKSRFSIFLGSHVDMAPLNLEMTCYSKLFVIQE
ncbi:hypothetical protein QUF79_07585 [Fictibacillus enclensis]|uniref:hypothetical protein n=1 Tax=Fictibacillus enclensis TaxID=1017270 RepID=UPI0025A19336|nr:hypothetical protein [Fictibacillus enclensis]MDM5197875.1 hypothetical protein [Fictibacillus enclensis]